MVYTLFFVFLIFGALIAKSRICSKLYLFTTMTFLFIMIGLRDTTVGTDTLGYTKDFARFAHMSFSQVCAYAFSSKEPLYVLISWLPSIFSTNYTAYLLTWALFPSVSLYKVFKADLKDSTDFMIATIVLFLLGLFAFYVAGIRQTAALSIVFAGAQYLKHISWNGFRKLLSDKNIYFFLLTIAIAYMIHNSSVLFVLAIACLLFKVRWWYLIMVIALFFLGQYVKIDQIVSISSFLFEDRFASYGTTYESSQNASAFIMQFLLFLICFIVRGRLIKRDVYNNFLFNMLFLGLVFQSLSGTMAEMARISFYFSMFAMILVPRSIKEYTGNIKIFVYVGFTIASLYYLFFITSSNLPEYNSILEIL